MTARTWRSKHKNSIGVEETENKKCIASSLMFFGSSAMAHATATEAMLPRPETPLMHRGWRRIGLALCVDTLPSANVLDKSETPAAAMQHQSHLNKIFPVLSGLGIDILSWHFFFGILGTDETFHRLETYCEGRLGRKRNRAAGAHCLYAAFDSLRLCGF